MLPFELEVLNARLRYWAGDFMGYLDALSALLRRCTLKARRTADAAVATMWRERGTRLCLIIASQLIEMKVRARSVLTSCSRYRITVLSLIRTRASLLRTSAAPRSCSRQCVRRVPPCVPPLAGCTCRAAVPARQQNTSPPRLQTLRRSHHRRRWTLHCLRQQRETGRV